MELSNLQTRISSTLGSIKPIYIIIPVVLIIAGEGIWAYQTFFKQQLGPNPFTSTQNVSNNITLSVSKNQYKIGDLIPVAINITANKSTAGVDLIIRYDPNLLKISSSSASVPVTTGNLFDEYPLTINSTTKGPVATGSLYDEYPANQVDEKNGIISVSGISNKTNGVIPNGQFGSVIFQAKAAGSARVFLEFTKNQTNATNIVDSKTSKNILEEVKNIDLVITQ